jgi:predicted enzyme related to lactoylglutathione lyase
MAGFNGIAWFEIGTDDPAGAEKFYGGRGPSGAR